MSASVSTGVDTRDTAKNHRATTEHRSAERRTTEAKAAYKTTEFIAFLAVLAAILVAGLVADGGEGALGAEKVWLYATILTVGYMVSRGVAKAGSRDPYTAERDNG
jgi:hypothetical protein